MRDDAERLPTAYQGVRVNTKGLLAAVRALERQAPLLRERDAARAEAEIQSAWADKVCVGFGYNDPSDYPSADEIVARWERKCAEAERLRAAIEAREATLRESKRRRLAAEAELAAMEEARTAAALQRDEAERERDAAQAALEREKLAETGVELKLEKARAEAERLRAALKAEREARVESTMRSIVYEEMVRTRLGSMGEHHRVWSDVHLMDLKRKQARAEIEKEPAASPPAVEPEGECRQEGNSQGYDGYCATHGTMWPWPSLLGWRR